MPVLVASFILGQIALAQAFELSEEARFTQFPKQFTINLDLALRRDCMGNYTNYLNIRPNPHHPERIASDLVACLLGSSAVTEAIKANMASAQVLLGFLPTFLAMVGCSPSETSLLGLRRPLLAILVTIGSPAPSWIQAFEYPDYNKMLQDSATYAHLQTRAWRIDSPERGKKNAFLAQFILSAELLLVVAAAVNTAHLACYLGFLTVSSFAPSRPWLVILWTVLGVLVHVGATIALRLRMRVTKKGHNSTLFRAVHDEFTICAMHGRTILELKEKESRWNVLMSWCIATGTAAIVVYGTLVFSSLLFISTLDATIVVVRYMVSALLCRGIVMYELDGMRRANTEDPDDQNLGLGRSGTEMHLLSPTEEVMRTSRAKWPDAHQPQQEV